MNREQKWLMRFNRPAPCDTIAAPCDTIAAPYDNDCTAPYDNELCPD